MVAAQRLIQVLRSNENLLTGAAFAVRGLYGVPLALPLPAAEGDRGFAEQNGLLHQRARHWMKVR